MTSCIKVTAQSVVARILSSPKTSPVIWSTRSTIPVACNIISIRARSTSVEPDMGVASSKSNGASHGAMSSSRPPSDSKREVSEGIATAPWILHGRGLVFPCMLPRETGMQYSAYAEDPNELVKFVGGIGAFILVNYTDSPVGPYKELVFVPGMYQYFDSVAGKVKTAHGISRIWVDNQVRHRPPPTLKPQTHAWSTPVTNLQKRKVLCKVL